VADYALVLSGSSLPPGARALAPIFGGGTISRLVIDRGGSFGPLRPLPQIPPYALLIWQVGLADH